MKVKNSFTVVRNWVSTVASQFELPKKPKYQGRKFGSLESLGIESLEAREVLASSFLSGQVAAIIAPMTVEVNKLEDRNNAKFFAEKSGVTLSSTLAVDASAPGNYFVSTDFTPATILAGTKINSYYLHADVIGTPTVAKHMIGSITFDLPILGIASTNANLNSSDVVGSNSTVYPKAGRATNPGSDFFSISADRKTITFDLQTAPVSDDLRIITSAIPLSAARISATFLKISGATPNGQTLAINTPTTVAVNGFEDQYYAKFFAEKAGVTLSCPLNVDASGPGVYSVSTDYTPATILAGTKINSYYLHADTLGQPSEFQHMKGSITFDNPILGIVSTPSTLSSSDLLGSSSTFYPNTGRATDQGTVKPDVFLISADRKTLTYDLQTAPASDDLRIITSAGPLSPSGISATLFKIPGATLKGQGLAINAPSTVAVNKLEDENYAKLFAEKSLISLSSGLNVDASRPGNYSVSTDFTPTTILPGTLVNSYYLHADVTGTPTTAKHMKGSITFDLPIIGIVSTDANLNASDSFGSNGTFYPKSARATDPGSDFFSISADRKTLTYDLQMGSASDDLRIITAAIPLSLTEINETLLTIPGTTLKGQTLAINAPATVAVNKFEDQNYAKFFAEKTGVTLSSALNVDASIAGAYSCNPSMTPATILAGTKVNTYYLHADTEGASTTYNHMKGTITFSTPILGVISTTANLNKSDYLGAIGTFYPSAQRKAEAPDAAHPDFFWISADRKTLTFDLQTSTASDDLRIVTEAAPVVIVPSSQVSVASLATVAKNVGVVALNWNAPAYSNNAALMNYLVQYSTDNGHTWNTACNTSGSDLKAKIVGLQAGVSYSFRVATVNALGVSSILAVNSYKLA